MKEIDLIDQLITQLKQIKNVAKRRERLSQKCFEMDTRHNTPRQLQKANNDLNWESMRLEQARTAFARTFKGSVLDVSTEAKEYNPSPFHNYKG